MARKQTPSEARAEQAETTDRGAKPPEGTTTSDKLVARPGHKTLKARQADAAAKRAKWEASPKRVRAIPPSEAAALGMAIADYGMALIIEQHPGAPKFPLALRAFESAVRHLRQNWRAIYSPAWTSGD